MSARDVPPAVDELIAAYADDPAALTAAERRAVEARCAEDPAAAQALAEARAALAALRAGAPAATEPDWSALAASIRDAVAREPAPSSVRRRRVLLGAAAVAAVAAIAALLWQARPRPVPDERTAVHDAAAPAPAPAVPDLAPEPPSADDLAAELDTGDLGAITLDDELIDEAAGDDLADAPDDEPAADDPLDALDPLVPDGTWIDDLSDDDLDRAIDWLAQEAG